ncbi:hypothetical protein ADK82_23175 [Streptomyces sp. NRRL S-4]|nr:hypothetical protein ADK82_23175 [Streptomyces sp. NRRL S-4]
MRRAARLTAGHLTRAGIRPWTRVRDPALDARAGPGTGTLSCFPRPRTHHCPGTESVPGQW